MDPDVAHIIGDCLCVDELMTVFAQGIDRRADPTRGYVLQMLAEYTRLAERLAQHARQRGADETAAELRRRASAARQRASYLRGQYYFT